MLSDIEPESLLDESRSQPSVGSDQSRMSPRAHPRLTAYRILCFALTAGFGAVKAVLSYRGQTTAPTTLDWIYGIIVGSALYWLGLYEEECPGKLPDWIFKTDVVESVMETVNVLRGGVKLHEDLWF
ncbi:hypothetical protein MVEN_00823400 [Mycena venus]|uniref:Uncharacterized protein n=1 Tax=Mycena venus TaxID=2733690 RepID=A0A8H7D0T4_9AGAR|nr:hypothetical protein MVEN_00823400 [Mycena venus]